MKGKKLTNVMFVYELPSKWMMGTLSLRPPGSEHIYWSPSQNEEKTKKIYGKKAQKMAIKHGSNCDLQVKVHSGPLSVPVSHNNPVPEPI